jgi:hypothetical protein
MFGARVASVATLPGVAALAYALADGDGKARAVIAAFLFVAVYGIAREEWDELDVRPVDAVVIALIAWLVLRPGSWTWLDTPDLGAYTDGATLAAATGLIAGVLSTLRWPPAGRSHAQ